VSTWATARNSQYFHPQGEHGPHGREMLCVKTLPGDDWQADSKAPDETRAQIMALAAIAGSSRIGFVSDPTSGPRP
jgi:hypothetical protein